MESANLLVVDRSPECAEHVNSLLRNSGIKIHVIHTSKAAEVKRAIDQTRPLLVLFRQPDEKLASLEEISALTQDLGIPLALYIDLEDPDSLLRHLHATACLVIHSGDESLLTGTVRRLMIRSSESSQFLIQKSRLEELEHRYDLLLDSSREAIAYIHEGLHVYANRAYLEALHVESAEEINGISLLEMMKLEQGDLKKLLRGLSKGDFPDQGVAVAVHRPDGSEFDATLTFSAARFNGEDCIQMMVQESNEAAELVAELERLRVMDPVTKLGNKRALVDRVKTGLEDSPTSGKVSAVLYIEPDGMSDLNDELDVAHMDEFLVELAGVLVGAADENDFAARVSDHGFALLATRPNMEAMEACAQQILDAFARHLTELGDRSFTVTCSIGIATLGRLAKDATAVIAGARRAQLEAAQKGNAYITFRPQLTAVTSFEDDRQWVDRIRFALGNGDFYAVQQPIVDLDGEGDHLVENFVYMRDEAGDLPPSEYLAIADRNDLAGQVDRIIIPGLLKGFAESSDRQIINLSTNSVLDYAFPAWFTEQVSSHCTDGERIILQIGAASAHSNLKPTQRLMQELASLGCHFSIADFGTEVRHQQTLEHLEAKYVKLHRSFTENLTTNSANQEAIRAIVDGAEERGAIVIADEVADTPSLAILWQCGVKLIAGAFLKENSQVVGQ
ncbi:EAL domain-containing protein [Elongatibacter sediminis]|uniref:EAL domain-containing protein n=1 Tax=Elongatibacter sediminis TaxID=3119006 RepID=A0AAW9RIQ8_9GAMM